MVPTGLPSIPSTVTQGVVGIVVLQGVEHVPTRCCQCCGGVAVHIAAGGIGGAVGAVTAHGEHCGVLSRQRRGCGQRQFLIASAQPFAGQVHHGFPPRDKGNR